MSISSSSLVRASVRGVLHSQGISCLFYVDKISSHRTQIEDYAKYGGPGEVGHLRSFYHDSLRTWIKTIVNKFAISNHTALILRVHALRNYLKLICEYELHSLPNTKS